MKVATKAQQYKKTDQKGKFKFPKILEGKAEINH